MLKRQASPWETTAAQNLVRYRPSGTYFARFKIGRKLIRKSLETTVFSVAKQRLPDKIREYRSRYESEKAFSNGRMNVGDAADVYLGRIEANPSLKTGTKRYYRWILEFIRRSWPTLSTTDVRKVTQRDCENWLREYQKHYSPTAVNNSIGVLRAVFQEALAVELASHKIPFEREKLLQIRYKGGLLPSFYKADFVCFGSVLVECKAIGQIGKAEIAQTLNYLKVTGLGRALIVNFASASLEYKRLVLTSAKICVNPVNLWF